MFEIQRANPEGAALRGLWSDPKFLDNVTELNPKLTHTQFADFHGHGWVFRAVFKTDRKGHLLDAENAVVAADDPDRFKKAVHLKDIHLEKGMHCVDCHFKQDNHGNGKLYGETRAAIEITASTATARSTPRRNLKTSGPAAPAGGTDLSLLTHAVRPAPLRVARRHADPALDGRRRTCSGRSCRSLDTIDPARLSHRQLQREALAAGQDDADATARRGATCRARTPSWPTPTAR